MLPLKRLLGIGLVMGVGALAWIAGRDWIATGVAPNYQPSDPVLHAAPLSFYRAQHPRALVWFFGNDVGFWGAQTRLAARLAEAGYDVVGLDWSHWARQQSNEPHTARAQRFVSEIGRWQRLAVRELGDDSLPFLLAGHSVGAEVALWEAAMAPPRGLAGVIAIAPGARGHLYVTAQDLAMREPMEIGSFAVDSLVGALPDALPVSLVRGSHDKARAVDAAIRALRPSVHEVQIPLAAHSLKRLVIAGPLIVQAVDWVARQGSIRQPRAPGDRQAGH